MALPTHRTFHGTQMADSFLSLRNKKIWILLNTSWNVFNFRLGLLRALQAQGAQITVLTPKDDYSSQLEAEGFVWLDIVMDNQGNNPKHDLKLLLDYYRLFKINRPDIILSYTIKPNIYATIAAHFLGIPVIANVAGLGTLFIRRTWLTRVVVPLYRFALQRAAHIFFQNLDDQQLFLEHGIVQHSRFSRIAGSGIDLQRFALTPLPPSTTDTFCFILIGRLLKDKGVLEFVAAARQLKPRFKHWRFQLLGFIGVANRTAIDRATVAQWEAEGIIEYLGDTDDVRPAIAAADCVVLPSYREGTPRTLLEAAAMGRPIITTDTVGCRDVVRDGENGWLVKVADADDLAEKMAQMGTAPRTTHEAMALAGRLKMQREYDERLVIEAYLAHIQAVLASSNKR